MKVAVEAAVLLGGVLLCISLSKPCNDPLRCSQLRGSCDSKLMTLFRAGVSNTVPHLAN